MIDNPFTKPYITEESVINGKEILKINNRTVVEKEKINNIFKKHDTFEK